MEEIGLWETPLRDAKLLSPPQPYGHSEWADRCEVWSRPNKSPISKRRLRQPKREPLILTGHGMRLRIENGTLYVRGGLTHFPQKAETWRFFPGDLAMPSRIVIVDGSGSLSFDVMGWLAQQKIPLIRVDWRGQVTSVVGNGQAADARCVERQRGASALPIAISIVRRKLENSIETLSAAIPQSLRCDRAIERAKLDIRELDEYPPNLLSKLLGIEGRSARLYFSALQEMPLSWIGVAHRPIPDDWYLIGPRQSANGGKKGKNQRASHPFNAMLNYTYAILESHVRTQIIAEGFDPSIGYLHSFSSERHALVFDLMEPLRPLVDLALLRFVSAQAFHPKDFVLKSDGVCRMNPELAKHLVREIVPNPLALAALSDHLGLGMKN